MPISSQASPPPSRPAGLAWGEGYQGAAWRAVACPVFAGQLALHAVGLSVVGFLVMIPSADAHLVAMGIDAVLLFCALLALALRRTPVWFELGAAGFKVQGKPRIALAAIDHFEVGRCSCAWGRKTFGLLVQLRAGESVTMEIDEHDPVHLRFVTARLNDALAAFGVDRVARSANAPSAAR